MAGSRVFVTPRSDTGEQRQGNSDPCKFGILRYPVSMRREARGNGSVVISTDTIHHPCSSTRSARKRLDVVLTETLPAAAAKIRRCGETGLVRETRFNVAGYKAISCAPALAPAGCGRRSSSTAGRSTSRPCPALPTPSKRRPRSATDARRLLPLQQHPTTLVTKRALLVFGIRILGRRFAGREQQALKNSAVNGAAEFSYKYLN